MTTIEKKTVQVPKELSLAEQILEMVQGNQAAVVLVPDGDRSMRMVYRGTGGAWWKTDFNEKGTTVRLESELRDDERAILITRDMVDGLLRGDICIMNPKDC